MNMYPQLKPHQSLLKMYKEHLQELYDKIMQFTDFGEQMILINRTLPDHFQFPVSLVIKQLQKIHDYVFQDQSPKFSKVQWQFIQFLNQFELSPAFVNQSQA